MHDNKQRDGEEISGHTEQVQQLRDSNEKLKRDCMDRLYHA